MTKAVPRQVAKDELLYAIQSGDVDALSAHLDSGVPLDFTDEEDWSLLHHAVAHSQVEIIKLLLAKGCCVDPVDQSGRTPLHYAAATGEDTEVIQVLLQAGSDIDLVDREGNTPLQWAVMCQRKAAIEEFSMHIEMQNKGSLYTKVPSGKEDGRKTILTGNLVSGVYQKVQTLSGNDFDLAVENNHNYDTGSKSKILTENVCQSYNDTESEECQFPEECDIFDAARSGDITTVKAYLDLGVPVDLTDEDGWSPVHHAIVHGQVEVIRLLMDRGCRMVPLKNFNPSEKEEIPMDDGDKGGDIFDAARSGDVATVKGFLDLGVPVDLTDDDGCTVLHCAAGEGHTEVVKLLIKEGCNIDPMDPNSSTPLDYAVAFGHTEVEAVLRNVRTKQKSFSTSEPIPFQPSISDLQGSSWILMLTAVMKGSKDMLIQLLSQGCPVDITDEKGKNPLHFAVFSNQAHVIEPLVKHGLDVNRADNDGLTPLHLAAARGHFECARELIRLGARKSMLAVCSDVGTPLHQAVASCCNDVVSLLLDEGCPIDVVNSMGSSPLHYAAQYGNIVAIEELVARGFNANLTNHEGLTPMHSAVSMGQLKSVHTLLKVGGWKSMTVDTSTCGVPLHLAVIKDEREIVSLLLDEGCPIEIACENGSTAFHFAGQYGRLQLIKLLVNHALHAQVDVNRLDNDGRTPLHTAAFCGQLKAVEVLLQFDAGRKAMEITHGECGSVLHQAVQGGHKEVALLLLSKGCPITIVNNRGEGVLHVAAAFGHTELLEMFAELGLDVTAANKIGYTPLHVAVSVGHLKSVQSLLKLGGRKSMIAISEQRGTPIHQAVVEGHFEIVRCLLAEGCPLDIQSTSGASLLHAAASYAQDGMIKMLVELGLDANIVDSYGRTPMHSAAYSGETTSVRALLKMGGRRSLTEVAGLEGTPLHVAAGKGNLEVVLCLLDEGCPIDVVNSDGSSVLHIAAHSGNCDLISLLAKRGLDVNTPDKNNYTALHAAAESGHIRGIQTLLGFGGKKSFGIVAKNHGTPLHVVASKGHKDIVVFLLCEGCPLDLLDDSGASALHKAALHGHTDVIKLLVQAGMDANMADASGWTPLHSAALGGKIESVRILLHLGGGASMFRMAGDAGTPLYPAVGRGHKEVALELLRAGCPFYVTKDLSTALHTAARFGQIELIELFAMHLKVNVNEANIQGWTPLHFAARHGQLQAVCALLHAGGRKSMRKVAGADGTPLHQAILHRHDNVVSFFLKENCPIDIVSHKGDTMLHFAAMSGHSEFVKLFVKLGLNVNTLNKEGCTPLHAGALSSEISVVRTLLELGGRKSLNTASAKAGTPLHQAAFTGNKDLVLYLLEEGCLLDEEMEVYNFSVLHGAAKIGQCDLMEMFVQLGINPNVANSDGWTPLHAACNSGQIESVRKLFELGGKKSLTAVAKGERGTPLHQAVLGGYKELVWLLLDEGCPIDVEDDEGYNVLQTAALTGHIELIEFFAASGNLKLNINHASKNGFTALHCAAEKGQLEAASTLLKLGARESLSMVATEFGGTPLHYPAFYGNIEMMSLLLDSQSKSISDEYSPANLVNITDSRGLTPLTLAAAMSLHRVDTIQFLVSRGASLDYQDPLGMRFYDYVTLLHVSLPNFKQLCKAGGIECDGEGFIDIVFALAMRGLLDINKLLCLASIFGHVGFFDALVESRIPLHQQKMERASKVLGLVLGSGFTNFLSSFRLSEDPINPLHIALLTCKKGGLIASARKAIYAGEVSITDFIERLTSHTLTRHFVRELFPNGLSPLDVARQFELHDIAGMIERAGGRPGMWSDLPKQMEQKCIDLLMSVKE